MYSYYDHTRSEEGGRNYDAACHYPVYCSLYEFFVALPAPPAHSILSQTKDFACVQVVEKNSPPPRKRYCKIFFKSREPRKYLTENGHPQRLPPLLRNHLKFVWHIQMADTVDQPSGTGLTIFLVILSIFLVVNAAVAIYSFLASKRAKGEINTEKVSPYDITGTYRYS